MRHIATSLILICLIALSASAQDYSSAYSNSLTVVVTTDSLRRPANATAYAANDVVNDSATTAQILEFEYAARATGGSGYVTAAEIFADTANVANATFRLYLFDNSVTGIADNAQFTFLESYTTKFVGFVDLALSTAGTGSTGAADVQTNLNIPFRCPNGKRSLYGVLVATGAYVPKFNGRMVVRLSIHRL